jgi:uncharacterized membrane protein
MILDSASVSTIILLLAASLLILATMLYPSSLLRWLQRKRYQYEVTFSLYMLTGTEKFIFSTCNPSDSSAKHESTASKKIWSGSICNWLIM